MLHHSVRGPQPCWICTSCLCAEPVRVLLPGMHTRLPTMRTDSTPNSFPPAQGRPFLPPVGSRHPQPSAPTPPLSATPGEARLPCGVGLLRSWEALSPRSGSAWRPFSLSGSSPGEGREEGEPQGVGMEGCPGGGSTPPQAGGAPGPQPSVQWAQALWSEAESWAAGPGGAGQRVPGGTCPASPPGGWTRLAPDHVLAASDPVCSAWGPGPWPSGRLRAEREAASPQPPAPSLSPAGKCWAARPASTPLVPRAGAAPAEDPVCDCPAGQRACLGAGGHRGTKAPSSPGRRG